MFRGFLEFIVPQILVPSSEDAEIYAYLWDLEFQRKEMFVLRILFTQMVDGIDVEYL